MPPASSLGLAADEDLQHIALVAGTRRLATHDTTPALATLLAQGRVRLGDGVVGRAGAIKAPFQVEDIATNDLMSAPIRRVLLETGRPSILAVPLLREDRVLVELVMARTAPDAFPPEVVALLETFATPTISR